MRGFTAPHFLYLQEEEIMKFKVKPYENYIEFYPNTQDLKQVFEAGSIVEVENIETDIQACKLIPCTDVYIENVTLPEEKKAETFDDDLFTPVVPAQSAEDKKKAAQDKLRAGSNN
jgi:hypothetical protein